MFPLLTLRHAEQETKITSLILEATPAEKIYLLGSTLMRRRTESIFATDAPSCRYVSHYYVLVLVRNNTNSNNTIQDKIENRCKEFIPVTAIVLDIEQFNNWMKEGHWFACRVKTKAIGLHDSESAPVTEPAIADEKQFAISACKYYEQGLIKVQEFMAGADLYTIRKQYKMAAFMLHQAAEQALHTLLKATTGLYINTHNIDKLIRYCSMVSYQLPDIFPQNNDKEKHLFKLLQSAYVDTRYRENYVIDGRDLMMIVERVRVMEGVVKETLERAKKKIC